MVQDAIEDLALARDPTKRIHFPPVGRNNSIGDGG
jgi:hypothetical protein